MEKFKKWAFIGDLHGNFEVATKAGYWAIDNKARPIFLGDLTDSFSKTKRAQLYTIRFVRNLLDAGGICIWGNHDLSYINYEAFGCSGYTRNKQAYFREAYCELLTHKSFKPFYYIKKHDVLVTHAGLDPGIIPDHYPDDLHPTEILGYKFNEENSIALTKTTPFLKVGRNSGGHGIGGITWLREPEATGSLGNTVQIVGHTPQDTCNFNNRTQTWYIDTIEYGDRSILMLDEGGNFEIIEEQQWNLKEQ